ncbi:MAG: redoxin domain-containing protein [Rhodobacteraceae bacterium]|jgi:peroxiredoxin (alkyl hydroperoxide reductase subunit C)|nr:redoxin domain-containing protein [Paracoccaceae bacterium]
MGVQLFGTGDRWTRIALPVGYRRTARWVPRIGDEFPDFAADSTQGRLRFRAWARGAWVVFFAHPAAFTPVCTTEIAQFAMDAAEFAARGARLLAISRDPVAEASEWARQIGEDFAAPVGFPIVADPGGAIVEACGMIHGADEAPLPVRKTFVIDPAGRIRIIMEYPHCVGRSVAETLRVLDALQASDRHGLVAPADWRPGDPLLVPAGESHDHAGDRLGRTVRRLRGYLGVVDV